MLVSTKFLFDIIQFLVNVYGHIIAVNLCFVLVDVTDLLVCDDEFSLVLEVHLDSPITQAEDGAHVVFLPFLQVDFLDAGI
jgi:hypothetical protein